MTETLTERRATRLSELFDEGRRELVAAGVPEAAGEMHCLIRAWTGKDLAWCVSRFGEEVEAGLDPSALRDMVRRRARRVPLAHILGSREFWGRSFRVSPGVFIPRPETELLVQWAAEDHRESPFSGGIELCCGCGAAGISLSLEIGLPVDLLDNDEPALSCARTNCLGLGMESGIHRLDLLGDDLGVLRKRSYDLILINPPYVPSGDIASLEPELRENEPRTALDGGESGLEFLMRVLPRIEFFAAAPCRIYVELGLGHREKAPEGMEISGWTVLEWRRDLAGIWRAMKLGRQ